MSALALLKVAAEGDLYTGSDGNPWNRAGSLFHGEASNEIAVALWECGLLSLPAEQLHDGTRRWELTDLGRTVLDARWKAGPPGFIPTPGGPYEAP